MNLISLIPYIKRSLLYLLLFISIFYIATYSAVGVSRIFYPYELWWFEGDSLRQVTRIITGQKIYTAPSIEYIPMIYAPLYFYLCAFFVKIFGAHLYILRLISFSSSLVTLYIIYRFIQKETKSTIFGIVGAGFFTATYSLTGASWDTARVDSLFVFLLFLSVYISRFGNDKKSHGAAAFLLVLAIMTKQSTILMVPFIAIYYFFTKRTFLLLYLIIVAGLLTGSILILNIIHHGWYSYYVYSLSAKHYFDARYVIIFLGLDMWKVFIALSLALIYPVLLLKNKQKNAVFYSTLLGGMITLSCLSRINIGGSSNTLIPMYASLAVGFGLSLEQMYRNSFSTTIRRKYVTSLIFLFSIFQYLFLFYNPWTYIPSAQTQESTKQLVSFIKQQPGSVFIPSNTYLLKLANKPDQADLHMLTELLGGFGDKIPTTGGTAIISQIQKKIRAQSYDAVILEKYDYYPYYYVLLKDTINAYYKKNNQTFSIWKGEQAIPVYIYTKKNKIL